MGSRKKGEFSSFDVFGNIVVMKFSKGIKRKDKKKIAKRFLKKNKSVKTALEKTRKFSGKFRRQKTRYLSGEKSKEARYKENGCVFRFNVDKTYFSSRLSNERKEIAKKVREGEKVLVMFAGVAPYSIVIAKKSKPKFVDSNEINKKANKYAELNLKLKKTKEKVRILPGDITKVAKDLSNENKKYDVIVMPRPQLKDSFLKEAFILSKKGTRIYYYDFCKEEDIENIKEKIKLEAKKENKKLRIISTKKAGEIAPYKYRIRVDFKVL